MKKEKGLDNLIDLGAWGKIQDKFSEVIKNPIYTIDKSGNIILKSGEFPFYCQIIHSKDKSDKCTSCRVCKFKELSAKKDEILVYYCPFGLLNVMVPIKVDGEQIGAVVCGSIVNKTRNVPLCRRVSQEVKVEAIELLDAIKEIPVREMKYVETMATMLYTLSQTIPNIVHEKRTTEKKFSELEILHKITNLLNSSLDLDKIFMSMVKFIVDLGIGDSCSIVVFDKENKMYIPNEKLIPKNYCEFEKAVMDDLLNTRDKVFIPLIGSDPRFKSVGDNLYSSLLSIPVKINEVIIGAITIYSNSIDNLNENVDFLSIIANQSALAIQNARQYSKIKQMAITDNLTNLYNRRYFMELLKNEVLRSRRFKKPLSVALIDIDDFGHYNNTHGHPMGDKLLREFSDILRSDVRSIDTVGRYGGEEFIIIIPDAGPEEASLVGERIRCSVEKQYFEGDGDQPGGRITISLGVATCINNSLSEEELIKEADKALYKAKSAGKNRVVSSIVIDKNLTSITEDVKVKGKNENT
jgi:diguanylate cyclase (GGDEF)-like protein